ncbi:MAG: glycoside hydrolase family 28 protein, partial [Oscillospiraceae bacterium]|nr:glycoside hydrolase family 28 protein [Oscillospiraceae bacterium]
MQTYNIRDYGACTSDKLQTAKIQTAIDDCFLAGGGRVVVPCGVYLTGSIRLRSRVELYLESGAILKGSRNPEDYFGYVDDKL